MDENKNLPIIADDNNEEEIEKEIPSEESIEIVMPFDPNDIRISNQPLNIGQIVDRLKHNELKLNANFKRTQEAWDIDKMSLLIESILLSLPIPAFYFDAQNYDEWAIIDGLQRIRTLKSFIIDNSFALQNLQFLKDLNGKNYQDLPRAVQRNMASFPITAVIIEKGTPLIVKYQLFCRLNNLRSEITPQEIRNVVFQGKVMDFIDKLATSEAFKKATNLSLKTTQMEGKDFVAHFLAFGLLSYTKYTPDVNTFINKGLETLEYMDYFLWEEIEKLFLQSMSVVYNIFGDDAFRKRFNVKDKKKLINKALFECLSVCLADLCIDENKILILLAKKELFKTLFIELNNNPRFLASITQDTYKKENVIYRFESIENIINKTLKNA